MENKSIHKYILSAIKSRPFLIYTLDIPHETVRLLFDGNPPETILIEINNKIRKDKEAKTARVQSCLNQLIHYREGSNIAKIIGVSTTTLRKIISGEMHEASYEIIDKIEVFLSTVDGLGFKCSIDNKLSSKSFLQNELSELVPEITSHCIGIISIVNSLLKDTQRANNTPSKSQLMNIKLHRADLDNSLGKLEHILEPYLSDYIL